MAEKRRAFEEWLQRRDRLTYDRYRTQRKVVKRAVKVLKRMQIGDGESDWEIILRVTKKMFWKEVK